MSAGAPAPHAGHRSLHDDCVHCGFCLPACPTWHSWSEEMDSPRGRIDLMRGLAEGKLEWSPQVVRHFDRCLGCLGCVTACPSGVRYDVLIEQTRARREQAVPRRGFDRDHYDLPAQLYPVALWLGAQPVSSREIVARLHRAGLRRRRRVRSRGRAEPGRGAGS